MEGREEGKEENRSMILTQKSNHFKNTWNSLNSKTEKKDFVLS